MKFLRGKATKIILIILCTAVLGGILGFYETQHKFLNQIHVKILGFVIMGIDSYLLNKYIFGDK